MVGVGKMEPKSLSLIKRRCFKGLGSKYVISLSLDEWVTLHHGRKFTVYEKCLEYGLWLSLSPFMFECLDYFS